MGSGRGPVRPGGGHASEGWAGTTRRGAPLIRSGANTRFRSGGSPFGRQPAVQVPCEVQPAGEPESRSLAIAEAIEHAVGVALRQALALGGPKPARSAILVQDERQEQPNGTPGRQRRDPARREGPSSTRRRGPRGRRTARRAGRASAGRSDGRRASDHRSCRRPGRPPRRNDGRRRTRSRGCPRRRHESPPARPRAASARRRLTSADVSARMTTAPRARRSPTLKAAAHPSRALVQTISGGAARDRLEVGDPSTRRAAWTGSGSFATITTWVSRGACERRPAKARARSSGHASASRTTVKAAVAGPSRTVGTAIALP